MRFDPKHKFNNKKVATEDGVFDSKGEYQRWLFLKDAESRGEVKGLQRQVKFILIPTQYRTEIIHLKTKDKEVKRVAEQEISYKADFVYFKKEGSTDTVFGEMKHWHRVVEDFKGYPNERWPYIKKMMLYFHGITVREVKKPTEPI